MGFLKTIWEDAKMRYAGVTEILGVPQGTPGQMGFVQAGGRADRRAGRQAGRQAGGAGRWAGGPSVRLTESSVWQLTR